VGDAIAQPGRVDGGACPANVVGTLQRASLGGQVDCAVASHKVRDQACEIVDIGAIAGTGTASVGMAVRKRGRTTGFTFGTVDTVDLTVAIDYGKGLGTVSLTNQIGIAADTAQSTQFGNNGDSGSVVVDAAPKVVGLYFAGTEDGSYSVANPIQAVLAALDISLCVPKGTELKIEKPEKFERKEFKSEKFEKFELKEHKFEKLEGKEFKNEKAEKEAQEKVLRDAPVPPGFEPAQFPKIEDKFFKGEKAEKNELAEFQPLQPFEPFAGQSVEDRLARLEAEIGQLTHFIPQTVRPDLREGALKREPDLGSSDPAALRRQLAKQATDTKQAKDNKDVEKLREG
jgi:hypothetical protein